MSDAACPSNLNSISFSSSTAAWFAACTDSPATSSKASSLIASIRMLSSFTGALMAFATTSPLMRVTFATTSTAGASSMSLAPSSSLDATAILAVSLGTTARYSASQSGPSPMMAAGVSSALASVLAFVFGLTFPVFGFGAGAATALPSIASVRMSSSSFGIAGKSSGGEPFASWRS